MTIGEVVDLIFEERIKAAKEELTLARNRYKNLRDQCKHGKKVYKPKYGGDYCEICERFLPRDQKKEEVV